MSATGLLDACGFIPASSGTGNFVVSAAIQGYQTPASAGAVNAAVYSYRAESADKSQWEEGFDVYTVSTTTLGRSNVTANSSGGTGKITFSAAPNVFVTALSADLQNFALLKGTGTNDSAAAGFVGEYVSSTVASGSAVNLTSGSAANVTSISLTPGDWDIAAIGYILGAGTTTINRADICISTVSGTFSFTAGQYGAVVPAGAVTGAFDSVNPMVPSFRASVSVTTTYYMVAQAVFGASTCQAFGLLRARRVR